MAHDTTWRPRSTHGKLTAVQEAALPDTAFAFPGQRALPLTDEGHVRNAIENFGDAQGVSDDDRDLAFANIRRAAAFYHVPMTETDWRQLGSRQVERSYARGNRAERRP